MRHLGRKKSEPAGWEGQAATANRPTQSQKRRQSQHSTVQQHSAARSELLTEHKRLAAHYTEYADTAQHTHREL